MIEHVIVAGLERVGMAEAKPLVPSNSIQRKISRLPKKIEGRSELMLIVRPEVVRVNQQPVVSIERVGSTQLPSLVNTIERIVPRQQMALGRTRLTLPFEGVLCDLEIGDSELAGLLLFAMKVPEEARNCL